MAGSAMYVGMLMYVQPAFLLSLPATILHTLVCILSHAWTVWLGVWFANVFCGVLQMIIIYHEQNKSSSPTLLAINYYNCTVMRCSFRTHFKGAH